MGVSPDVIKRVGAAGIIAISLIAPFEGEKLKAYYDQPGVATICYGHTKGVKITDKATPGQCKIWLGEDTGEAEAGVNRLVKVKISDQTKGALISFAFNEGVGTFARSSIRKDINAGNIEDGCIDLMDYVCVKVKAGTGAKLVKDKNIACATKRRDHVVDQGLVTRRLREEHVCQGGIEK